MSPYCLEGSYLLPNSTELNNCDNLGMLKTCNLFFTLLMGEQPHAPWLSTWQCQFSKSELYSSVHDLQVCKCH